MRVSLAVLAAYAPIAHAIGTPHYATTDGKGGVAWLIPFTQADVDRWGPDGVTNAAWKVADKHVIKACQEAGITSACHVTATYHLDPANRQGLSNPNCVALSDHVPNDNSNPSAGFSLHASWFQMVWADETCTRNLDAYRTDRWQCPIWSGTPEEPGPTYVPVDPVSRGNGVCGINGFPQLDGSTWGQTGWCYDQAAGSFNDNGIAYAVCASSDGTVPIGASGDPHLSLPHGGKADFRGEDKTIYNFLSAKDLSLNVMTETADFELHPANSTRHKDVHGSFITQAHVIARTSTGKTVTVSYYASKIGSENIGWANGTVDSETFTLSPNARAKYHKSEKVVDEVQLKMGYSSLTVRNTEFEIVVTPELFRLERNVVGLHHRLDVQIKPRIAEGGFKVSPHGIIGQGWDGDGKAIDGERDVFPETGVFTTYAMAKGAIEGVPSDYKMAKATATDFKYSRFDATTAAPRDVAKLVAEGLLNQPKMYFGGDTVGTTEITEEHM